MSILDNYTKRILNLNSEELKTRLSDDVYRTPANSGQGFGRVTNHFINKKFEDSTTFRNIVVYRKNETFSFRIDARVNDIERMGSIRRLLFRPINVNTIINIPPTDLIPLKPPFEIGDRWIQKISGDGKISDILVKGNNWDDIRGEFLVNTNVYEAVTTKSADENVTMEDWKLITNGVNMNNLVKVGDILYFDDDYWIVYDSSGSINQGASVEAQIINNSLKWIDKDGKFQKVKGIMGKGMLGSKSQMRVGQIDINPYGVNLAMSMLRCFVEWNDATKDIKLNQRFIIGRNVYQIISIDDMSYFNYETNTGILQFILDITTTIPEKDDFDKGIAYNEYETNEGETGIIEDDDNWGWR